MTEMIAVSGGTFLMGSADFYPEERPVRAVAVDSFRMDAHPVTAAEFRRFVKATGYVTSAELTVDPADFPDADRNALVPGALVFRRASGPVDLSDWRQWWSYAPGADWRHPLGGDSTLNGRELHPVTQVSYGDAAAYAAWAGKDLPTEAEWEYAARGGLDAARYAWGDEFSPKGRRMANTWHGEFPWEYQGRGARVDQPGTTAVKTFPPNGYGLYDMTGNIWEWTVDYYSVPRAGSAPPACCAPRNPRVDEPDVDQAEGRFQRRVTKGGSHLCAPNYCLRYRPAARQGQTEDTATCHLGFRCIVRG
jgi:sulfatase modifying factor 1